MPELGDLNLTLKEHLALDRCPHCGVASPTLVRLYKQETEAVRDGEKRTWGVYVCKTCGGLVTAACPHGFNVVTQLYPYRRKVDDAIPAPAKEYLNQALESLHTPDGAAMLTASAVDAMLKSKGFEAGTLNQRIDNAVKDSVLTSDMGTWAHHVRLEANDPRHADVDRPHVTKEEARQTIEFALALADLLFVLPARVREGLKKARGESAHKGASD